MHRPQRTKLPNIALYIYTLASWRCLCESSNNAKMSRRGFRWIKTQASKDLALQRSFIYVLLCPGVDL